MQKCMPTKGKPWPLSLHDTQILVYVYINISLLLTPPPPWDASNWACSTFFLILTFSVSLTFKIQLFYQKCKKYHKTQDGRNLHDWADYAWMQSIFSKSQLAADAKLGKLEGTAVTEFQGDLLYHLKKDVCGIKFLLYYLLFQ